VRVAPSVDLGSLAPGTHLCAFHRDDAQLARIAGTFVGHGLSAGDQLLYIATDAQADTLLSGLSAHLDTSDLLASGQLLIRSFADAYGTRRPDDLAVITDGFRAAAAQSRKDGFAALRVAAQMDQLAPFLGSHEEACRWERLSTELQHDIGVSSVCLYGVDQLDEHQVTMLSDVHAGRAPEHAEPPAASFLAVPSPGGFRVSGEIDIANHQLLRRALLARAEVTPRLHLDLRELRFADVGALTQLRAVAAALPEDGCLLLDHTPAVVRRTLDLCELHHERMVVQP
jgi:anti-anti-sigma regulatory factor